MKYFCRFGKLLFSNSFCKEEDVKLKQLLMVVVSTGVLSWLVFTELGRQIIKVLSVGFCGILIGDCIIFLILYIMTIVRKYKKLKRKWQIEEIMNPSVEVENNEELIIEEENKAKGNELKPDEEIQLEGDVFKQDDEILSEGSSNEPIEEKEVPYKAPVFFLDLTALEQYSGKFYAGYLTECFNFDWLTNEINAILVTDQSILKDLKDMENDSHNKLIYPGYTAYIMRYFRILPNEDSSNVLSNVLKYAEEKTVTYVTRNTEFANFMTENGISVKLID